MDDTAGNKRRATGLNQRGLTALGSERVPCSPSRRLRSSRKLKRGPICLAWFCLCGSLLLCEASGQQPQTAQRPEGAAPLQQNPPPADSDPMMTAERLLADPRPSADDASYGRTLIETARAVGRKGELQTALQLLHKALDHYRSGPLAEDHRSILMTRLGMASAAWQLGKHDLVIEQTEELLRLPSDGSDLAERVAAQQLLIKALQQVGRFDRALEITGELAHASAAAKGFALEHATTIGGAALRSGQLGSAAEAYRFYLEHAPQGGRTAEAVLGVAWAAALGAEPPQQAEQLLADFVTSYPEHADVPHALRAQAKLLKQLNRSDDAQRTALVLLEQHPESEAAFAVLEDLLSSPPPWPEPMRIAWLQRLAVSAAKPEPHREPSGRPTGESTEIIESLLVGSLAHRDDMLWNAAVGALVAGDADGSQSRLLLESLTEAQQGHVAEHLVVDLLGQIIDRRTAVSAGDDSVADASVSPHVPLPAACEAACRWAGLTGRWSMLALAAGQLQPATEPAGGAPADARRRAIDRMLAESLMQTRRSQQALPWWNAIIDVQGADDFATLLRGAEAAVAHGSLDNATKRLSEATAASGAEPFQTSLVQMLDAELAIRRARMDEARDLLSAIVRGTDSAAELRPRAQWMIGETYFLQTRYADAIDAYRRVDALDAEGEWAAAALLQAGKAFEKLARTREAATCYTALTSRFGATPHAAQARTRLAQLGGETPADAPLRR